jgi:hypothetical protein
MGRRSKILLEKMSLPIYISMVIYCGTIFYVKIYVSNVLCTIWCSFYPGFYYDDSAQPVLLLLKDQATCYLLYIVVPAIKYKNITRNRIQTAPRICTYREFISRRNTTIYISTG